MGAAEPQGDWLAGAVDAEDAESLTFAAHSLKGESASLGALRLAESARLLEEAGRSGNLSGAEQTLERAERELARVLIAIGEIAGEGA